MDGMADKQDQLEGQGKGRIALAVRPTELDLALCEQICNRIAKGQTLQTICEEDWRWPTFQQALLWLSQSADFAYWYSMALSEHEDRVAGEMASQREGKSRVPTEKGSQLPTVATYTEQPGKAKKFIVARPTEPDANLCAVICHLIATSSLSLEDICEDPRFPTLQVAFQWLASNSNFAVGYSLALIKNLAKKQLDPRSTKATYSLCRKLATIKCGNTNALAVLVQEFAKEVDSLPIQEFAGAASALAGVEGGKVRAALKAVLERMDPIDLNWILFDEKG